MADYAGLDYDQMAQAYMRLLEERGSGFRGIPYEGAAYTSKDPGNYRYAEGEASRDVGLLDPVDMLAGMLASKGTSLLRKGGEAFLPRPERRTLPVPSLPAPGVPARRALPVPDVPLRYPLPKPGVHEGPPMPTLSPEDSLKDVLDAFLPLELGYETNLVPTAPNDLHGVLARLMRFRADRQFLPGRLSENVWERLDARQLALIADYILTHGGSQ